VKHQFLQDDCTILVHNEEKTHNIHEAVMLTRHGSILPLLEKNLFQQSSPVLRYFLSSMTNYMNRLYSIIGLYDDVRKIEGMLPEQASHHVDYYLMTVTEDTLISPDFISFRDMVVKKASPADAEKLFSLQRMYELEEVFIDPLKFNPKVCLSCLKDLLRKELVVYVEANGIPVAKAGTNARGFYTDQIGGVYTETAYRRKGIARGLMYLLLKKIFSTKKIASLFVKKNNTSAITLYRKLGFEIREDFRISYFF
jgi:predicted GNAT family acetyltransferase